jgi:hypothetical protein
MKTNVDNCEMLLSLLSLLGIIYELCMMISYAFARFISNQLLASRNEKSLDNKSIFRDI